MHVNFRLVAAVYMVILDAALHTQFAICLPATPPKYRPSIDYSRISMRLHYFLLVAGATFLASSDTVAARTGSAQFKLLTTTSTDSVPVARSLTGTLNESNGKRSLRTAKTVGEDEDDQDGDDDEDGEDNEEDDDEEERSILAALRKFTGIEKLKQARQAKRQDPEALLQKLFRKGRISKEQMDNMRITGISADDIRSMVKKNVKR